MKNLQQVGQTNRLLSVSSKKWHVSKNKDSAFLATHFLVKSHLYQRSFVPKWKIGPICTKIIQLVFWLVELWANE